MQNAADWRPTKYASTPRGLRASRDPANVSVSSRLLADLIAAFYQDAISRYAHGDLLDLGCGRAPLYGAYAPKVASVTCVDWENSLHPNPHLDLIQDLNDSLKLDSEAFDVVILSDVLEHIREPASLMREIFRVLRPEGRLVMNTPFMYWLHEWPHDYYRYTESALRHLADAADFTVESVTPLGGGLEVSADLTAKWLATVPKAGGPLASAVQATAAAIRSRRPVRTQTAFPLAYTMVAAKSAAPGRADSPVA